MSTERRSYDLPSLPFELQLQILSNVPAVDLFRLTRVSRSWYVMLSNPALHSYMLDSYPFLTSCTTLTSLVRLRLRLLRNKPFKLIYRPRPSGHTCIRELFSNGYEVTVIYPMRRLIVATPFYMEMEVRDRDRRRIIASVGQVEGQDVASRIVARADILGLLESEFAEMYARFVGERTRMNAGTRIIPSFVQICAGQVMVGLVVEVLREWTGDGEVAITTMVPALYVLCFSLSSGFLTSALSMPAPAGYKKPIMAVFNGEVVSVGWIPAETNNRPKTIPLAFTTYALNTNSHLSTITDSNMRIPNPNPDLNPDPQDPTWHPAHHYDYPLHLDAVGNLYFPAQRTEDGLYRTPIKIGCIDTTTGTPRNSITLPEAILAGLPHMPTQLLLGAVPGHRARMYAIQIQGSTNNLGTYTNSSYSTEGYSPRYLKTTRIPLPSRATSSSLAWCVNSSAYASSRTWSSPAPEEQHPVIWGRTWEGSTSPWWVVLPSPEAGGGGLWSGVRMEGEVESRVGGVKLKLLGRWLEGNDAVDAFRLPGWRTLEGLRGLVEDCRSEMRGSPDVMVVWGEEYIFDY